MYYNIYYLADPFLLSFTTKPLSAANAKIFGMTMSALKKSASSHTKSTFNVEPRRINKTTKQEYILTAFSPNRYFTLIAPKKCQLRIVENAKNNKQIATYKSPQFPKQLTNAACAKAVPVFPVDITPVHKIEKAVSLG